MNKDLLAIFEYLEREKGIKRHIIIQAIEEALLVAARKGHQGINNLQISIDSKTGEISSFTEKEIVDVVQYPAEEISLEEALLLDPNCQKGDWIDVDVAIQDLGRIAAQVTRQLISQKIRNAERDVIYQAYRKRINQLISGTVSKIIRHTLIVNLGKVEAVLPARFYPKTEKYHIGDKVFALLQDVQETENGGAEVILSRAHPEFVSALFMQEVPEFIDGIVQINRIVRDPGFRTKIAVSSTDPKVDPVGSFVGVRGMRVKNIIRELNNEKIDIIPFSEDSFVLLKNAFSPIDILKASYDEEKNTITLIVNDDDYPAILGKKGNNVRLTSELIGMEVEVKKVSDHQKELTLIRKQLALTDDPALDQAIHTIKDMNQLVIENILAAGFDTPRKILQTSPQELANLTDISIQMADNLLEQMRKEFAHKQTLN